MTLVQRLVILVVLALAPALTVIAYSTVGLREAQQQAILSDATRIAGMVGAHHRLVITNAVGLLGTLAQASARAARQPDFCAGLLAPVAAAPFNWFDLLVLDNNGIVRCSSLPGTVGSDRSAMPEVRRAMTVGGLAIGVLEASAFAAEPSLPAAVRWQGSDGSDGALLLILRPGAMVVPRVQALLPTHAAVLVVDRGGRILYALPSRPRPDGNGTAATIADILGRVRLDADRGRWADGTDRIMALGEPDQATLPGVRVLVGIDQAAVRADVDEAVATMTWMIAVTLLGAILIATLGAVRYIRAPLGVLRAAALRWRDGDRATRVRLPGRSEIAALGRVFDEMADATERGERRIREAADLLNALIESSTDGIFVADRAGQYLLVNSTFAGLMGRPRAALIGQRDVAVIASDMHALVAGTRQSVLETGRPAVCDLILPRADVNSAPGDKRVLHTIFAPILAADGTVSAIAGIARDVTDERDAEAALRAAKERAEAADQSKTRFLAAASHDLRQPVQAAILFASLIGEHVDPDLRKPAEQLRLVLDDLRAMLDSLFDVSRYDAQVVQPDFVPFRLQPLIDQVIAAAETPARAKKISLIARPTEAWVRSDRTLLGRMISNIVENAVRYTNTGMVSINCIPIGNLVRIEVRDTGPGIAAEDLSRIWQEFEQLHNPERDRRQGLGLGLAIVRRLSRLLGHPVNVTSTPGQGSCFTIEVPATAAIAPMPLPDPVPEPASYPAGERIAVVVEDDAALLTVLAMILEEHGWTVLSASDDLEALRQLLPNAPTPRVILTDYRLRDGKLGSEAIATIRARAGRAIPAIILTGEIADDVAESDGPQRDASRLGAVTVLRKPVGAADLVATVSRMATRDAA